MVIILLNCFRKVYILVSYNDIKMKFNEYFIGKVLKVGNSSGVVIPKRNLEYSGLEIGDTIKVYYKKQKHLEANPK